jgi:hydrogenase nickel incorporation protein HypA/HybF
MHELSIADELLHILFKNAEKAGISKIHKVNLRIGEYSGIFPDSLEFAFEILSQDRMTEGAKLNIESVPPRFSCQKCKSTVLPQNGRCEKCGSEEIVLTGGNELEIISFEGD